MLDQCTNTILKYILQPWSSYMQSNSHQKQHPPTKYEETFTASTGVIRNLSSYSPDQNPDRARDFLRHTDGLLDALVDIVNVNLPGNIVESHYFENIICALRNLTYKCAKEQPAAKNPQAYEKSTCCSTKKVEAEYTNHPQWPEDSPSLAGISKLLHCTFAESIMRLMGQVQNKLTLEALVGILQNLTSDNYKSSCYLRAFIRERNGIPKLVELVEQHGDDNVANSAIVTLRNLAEDIKNKEVIGQYGAKAISGKLPTSTQQTYSTKTAVSALYLVRSLIYLNRKNCDLFIDAGGMQKIIDFNLESSYPMKIRKVAGQVLTVAWELSKMHSKFKKCGWKAKHFEPCVPSGNATMKKSKKPAQGLNPEQEQLISDTNV